MTVLAGLLQSNSGALLGALDRSLAIATYDPSGKILSANAKFCATLGYELPEIIGRNHKILVDPGYASTDDCRAFWAKLLAGDSDTRDCQRIGRAGNEIWLQATYSPVIDSRGRIGKIVQIASDVTEEKLRRLASEGKVAAITRVQAVIEFNTGGEIIAANKLFLDAVEYSMEEIAGRHHRILCKPEFANSEAYTNFWRRLNRGDCIAGEFARIGRNRKEIWLQISYNPILDANGRVMKIVALATDTTGRVYAAQMLGKGLAELAEGNLSHRIDAALDPLYEKLRTDYNAAAGQLHSLVGGIAGNTAEIRSGTGEIAQAAEDLARRTEQQAATLEQTAAALDEITTNVRRTAEGARTAGVAVRQARAEADRSDTVVRGAVSAMSEIEQSARQISQIIGVIDEIAFQTNLLALNAGVEAARAGDVGRGFAVVAAEVRALAQRSAEAAKEIKALISVSTQQVGRGVDLVGEAGRALSQIAKQVVDIDAVVNEIAASAQEQATGLAEVNTAVNEMDQVTQQNAAMVEQSTAATLSLAHETKQLAGLTSRFRLGDATPASISEHSRPKATPAMRQRPALAVVGDRRKRGQAEDWEEF